MDCFIVEDSRLAREDIKRLLQEHLDFSITGEAENAGEAIDRLNQFKPELVFMDINLNERNGFEVLAQLNYQPWVIFITAYDQFALRSFEFNTLDYLVKPIDTNAFSRSLDKARKYISAGIKQPNFPEEQIFSVGQKIFIKDGEKCYFVNVEDIFLFEVSGPYTKVYFDNVHPSVPRPLNLIEEKMDPKLFFRANRNQIVNLNFISQVVPWFNHTFKLKLKQGTEIELSRRKSQEFREQMSI